MKTLTDKFGRVHDYLRISLIDRCNLNCFYCNPTDNKTKSVKYKYNLTNDELIRLIKIFVINHGVKKIRFTGGEPMIRRDIMDLFERVSEIKKDFPFTIALTSNGTTLAPHLEKLKKLGLDRLNLSLDTLDRQMFEKITGHDEFLPVMESIEMAEKLDFHPLKINAVGMRGLNDRELTKFVDYFKDRSVNLRFIEFMPFGNNDWNDDKFISYQDMKDIIETEFPLKALEQEKHAVAKDYQVKGHKCKVSFISSISDHFCDDCNRLRIGSSGKMKLCLLSKEDSGVNFRELFRSGVSDEKISEMLMSSLQLKDEKHPPVQQLVTFSNNQMMAIGG